MFVDETQEREAKCYLVPVLRGFIHLPDRSRLELVDKAERIQMEEGSSAPSAYFILFTSVCHIYIPLFPGL